MASKIGIDIDVDPRKAVQGVRQVEDALEDLGDAAQQSGREASGSFAGIGTAARGLAGRLGMLAGPAAIGGVALGFGKLAAEGAQASHQLLQFQSQVGVSAATLENLARIARGSGGDVTDVVGGFEELRLRISEAVLDGVGPAAEALTKLGLSAQELNVLPAEEQFLRVRDALAAVANQSDRRFLSDEMFGGDAIRLQALLEPLPGQFDAIREAAGGASQETIEAAAAITPTLSIVSDRVKDVGKSFASWTLGPLNSVLEWALAIPEPLDNARTNAAELSTVIEAGLAATLEEANRVLEEFEDRGIKMSVVSEDGVHSVENAEAAVAQYTATMHLLPPEQQRIIELMEDEAFQYEALTDHLDALNENQVAAGFSLADLTEEQRQAVIAAAALKVVTDEGAEADRRRTVTQDLLASMFGITTSSIDTFLEGAGNIPEKLEPAEAILKRLNNAVLDLGISFVESAQVIARTAVDLGVVNASLDLNVRDMFSDAGAQSLIERQIRLQHSRLGIDLDSGGGTTSGRATNAEDEATRRAIKEIADSNALIKYYMSNAQTAAEARELGQHLIDNQYRMFDLTEMSENEQLLAIMQTNDEVAAAADSIVSAQESAANQITSAMDAAWAGITSALMSAQGRGTFDPVTGQFVAAPGAANRGTIDALREQVTNRDELIAAEQQRYADAVLSGNMELAAEIDRKFPAFLNNLEQVVPRRLAEEIRLGRRSQAAQQTFARQEHQYALAGVDGYTIAELQARRAVIEGRLASVRGGGLEPQVQRWELELARVSQRILEEEQKANASLNEIEKNTRPADIVINVTVEALQTSLGRQQFQDSVVDAFRQAGLDRRLQPA